MDPPCGPTISSDKTFGSRLATYHEVLDREVFKGASISGIFKDRDAFPLWLKLSEASTHSWNLYSGFKTLCRKHDPSIPASLHKQYFHTLLSEIKKLYGNERRGESFDLFFCPAYSGYGDNTSYALHLVASFEECLTPRSRRFAERLLTGFVTRFVDRVRQRMEVASSLANNYLSNQAKTRGHNLGHAVEHILQQLQQRTVKSTLEFPNEVHLAEALRYYRGRDTAEAPSYELRSYALPVTLDGPLRPFIPEVIAKTVLANCLRTPPGISQPATPPHLHVDVSGSKSLALPNGFQSISFLRSMVENLGRNALKHAADIDRFYKVVNVELAIGLHIDSVWENSRFSPSVWADNFDRLAILVPSYANGATATIHQYLTATRIERSHGGSAYRGMLDLKLSTLFLRGSRVNDFDNATNFVLIEQSTLLDSAEAPPIVSLASGVECLPFVPELGDTADSILEKCTVPPNELTIFFLYTPKSVAAGYLNLTDPSSTGQLSLPIIPIIEEDHLGKRRGSELGTFVCRTTDGTLVPHIVSRFSEKAEASRPLGEGALSGSANLTLLQSLVREYVGLTFDSEAIVLDSIGHRHYKEWCRRFEMDRLKVHRINVAHQSALLDCVQLEVECFVPSYSFGDRTPLRLEMEGRVSGDEASLDLLLHLPRLLIVDSRLNAIGAFRISDLSTREFYAVENFKFSKSFDCSYRDLRAAEGVHFRGETQLSISEVEEYIHGLTYDYDYILLHASWLENIVNVYGECRSFAKFLSTLREGQIIIFSDAGENKFCHDCGVPFLKWHYLKSEVLRASKASLVKLIQSVVRAKYLSKYAEL